MDADTRGLGPGGGEKFGGAADAGDPDQPAAGVDEGPAGAASGGDPGILETADREPAPGPAEGGDAVAAAPDADAQVIGEEPRGEPTPPLLRGCRLPLPAHPPPRPADRKSTR